MTDDDRDIDELLKHGPWLEQLARSLVRDPHAAADVVQSTWLSAMRRPPSSAVRIRAWLRTVLFNEVRQASRSRERRLRHESLAEPRASELSGSTEKLDDLRAELTRTFNELEEPYRSVLRLHFFDGLTSAEIGAKLRVPPATIRGQVRRGLERLRTQLERRFPGVSIEVLFLPLFLHSPTHIAPSESSTATPSGSRRSWFTNPLVPLSACLLAGATWLFVHDGAATASMEESVASAELPPPSNPLVSPSAPDEPRTPARSETARELPVESATTAPARLVIDVEVRDAMGTRQGDAAVFVFHREGAVFTEVARTDSFGAAHVTVDPIDVGAWGGKGASGRVAIRASAEGWACSDVTLASTTRGGRALRLVLPARESIFSGQLVDESGRPVAGADVELGYAQANQLSGVADADPSLPQPVRAVSDESGRFVAHGIDGSRGRVRVHAARADLVPTFVEQAVDGAAERACTIVLSAGGRVHGVVRDANGDPVPAARVWHEPAQQGGDAAFRSVGYVGRVRGWCSSTVADSEGTFDLAAVVPGARLLWAQNPSKPDELAHAMLDVASGASVSWNPELEHREPLQVVLDAGARAPHGWIVRLFFDGPNGRCIRESVTDGAGGASFYDVCADAIDVSVYAADTGFLAARSRIDRRENAAARVVLDEPAHIAGQLVDAQGAPFQDGILRLVPKDGQAPWTQLSYDAESGTFEHTLPASAFLLVASHGGSNVRIAELELAPGLRVELGPLRVPALSKLRLAHGAIPSIAGLEYRIVQIGPALPPSINMRVEVGAWPPPAERDLFPGDYVVESGSFLAKEVRVDRSVPVTLQAGGDVTLQLAP